MVDLPTVLKLIAGLLLVISAVLNALALWRGLKFTSCSRRKVGDRGPAGDGLPPVTILVPVCGLEPDAEAHFRRFLDLDWPAYQVVFTVLDPADPCIPVLREIESAGDSSREVNVNVGGLADGQNLKIRNLLNAWPLVRHEWLVLCDADVVADPGLLRRLLTPLLSGENVGMTHSLYCCRDESTLSTSLENVWINCDYWTQGLFGAWVKGVDFAFGATMAFSKSMLARIGGFEAVKDHLADDFQLGNRVARLGMEVRFADGFVTLRGAPQGFMDVWKHLLRWSRTVRVCNPGGFAGSLILNLTSLAIFALLLDFRLFIFSALAAIGCRILFANAARNLALGVSGLWKRFWLIPCKDVLQFMLWVLAFRNGEVVWRGSNFRVLPDGTLQRVNSD
jgi:ceramide glucosyltransferase